MPSTIFYGMIGQETVIIALVGGRTTMMKIKMKMGVKMVGMTGKVIMMIMTMIMSVICQAVRRIRK